ncbi:MAG: tRNA 2-selenouridine(34) synthase MnmH [Gammaproteobacteria bacterium]|nr:tRNA 2-selenouridine(34) synthase MnmH [Gammaproteobacteria bacterium]
MNAREDSNDYRQLFLQDVPLLDLRAPVEFERGAFPGAVNIPLLDDQQREQIGIRYKDAGQDEAIRLGLELATPQIREQRLRDWIQFCESNPGGYLYCFRGGLRSRTAQQWLRERGVDYPLVRGGYKAMRRFLIDELERALDEVPLVCVSGLTGVGKTRVLRRIRHHIDFEGLANHRGSAFGHDALDSQPAVIDWENAVAIAFLRHRERFPGAPVFVEDEGRMIGRISMPDGLYAALLKAPRAVLQVDIESRIRLIGEDYIQHNWPTYRRAHAANAEHAFRSFVLDNLSRIQRRLGGERYRQVRLCFEHALDVFFRTGQVEAFYPGIGTLLEQYYDPMYRYQIETKQPQIIFEGPEQEFLQWAKDFSAART